MRSLSLIFVALFAACGGPAWVQRTPVLLPGPTQAPVDVTREGRVLAAADRSRPVATPVEPLQASGGTTITYRTVTQIVEKPVEVVREVPAPVYQYDDRYSLERAYHDSCSQPFVPVNTIIGTGMGALIGDASGNAADGAWIGAGIGLMLDLGNLCW